MQKLLATFALIAVAAALFVAFAPKAPEAQSAPATEPAKEEVASTAVEYKAGDAGMEGWLARPANRMKGQTWPAVLLVPDWMGLKQWDKDQCDRFAAMGYIALAVDMYGKGVRPANATEARAQTGGLYGKPELLRERITAALTYMQQVDGVDKSRIAAIGFCFGGTTVLELARSGAEVAGVVSFHGGLKALGENKGIKGKVLVLHGADDPMVPPADVSALMDEMRAGKVDWYFTAYGNSVHSFTNPNAGSDNSKGSAYNATADARSWEACHDFFREVFAK